MATASSNEAAARAAMLAMLIELNEIEKNDPEQLRALGLTPLGDDLSEFNEWCINEQLSLQT